MVFKLENEMVSVITARVGDRVECLGHFGTVKYVGPVKGYESQWLGVDWDSPDRGKHNGIVNGIRYFVASHDRSGSLVKPEKVNLGQSAVKAVMSRYGHTDDLTSAKLTEQQLLSIKQTLNAPFVQFVGFDKVADKQSNFNSLQVVNLRLQSVANVGRPNELLVRCPNIVELDVSKNLIKDWDTIFEMCRQLVNLQWLNVSENLLHPPGDITQDFPNMRFLICGSMRLDWEVILQLCKIFQNLEELRAPHNNITTISMPKNHLTHLKLLDLEANPIQDWSEITKLTTIGPLEQLNLENTQINHIAFANGNVFKSLKKLVISNNEIMDWQSIGELNKLPCLEDLRFLKNPLLETENYATCIQLIIARIAGIKLVNGTAIRDDERKGAEYDYIKKYGLEWLRVKDDAEVKAAFLEANNRFEELIEKYGTPEESELVIQTNVIKVSLVEVQFQKGSRVIMKKLPPSMPVQKLIMLTQKMFGLDTRPTLTYVSGSESQIEIELTDEGKELGFYSVQSGDKIIVKDY